jgi:glycosyltransferase involved in cell wall biosynthesis
MEAGIPERRVERLKSSTVEMIRRAVRLNRAATSAARNEIPVATQNAVPLAKPEKQAALASEPETHRTAHQFHSGSSPGDAVTNSMLLMQRSLRSLGYASEIFVQHRHPQLAHRLFEIDDLPEHGDYILIVHHSMGYDVCERIASLPARKVLMYHNITPPEFLGDFPEYIPYAELGRQQLSWLRPRVAAALANSEFTALELRKHGYDSPVACPFLFDVDRLIADASQHSLRPDGKPFTVLFVGRVVASKGQADLVDAFAEFRNKWSAPCRLVLIGRMASPDAPYPTEIRRRASLHELQNEVLLTGLVSDYELSEWYRTADLYVSLSLHEGFGVPLIEAMAYDVPVLAWPAGAIPYTLAGGGEPLYDRSPSDVAAAMLRIARDPGLRESIVIRQRKALDRFRLDRQLPHLIQALMKAGAATPPNPEERRALAANLRFTLTGHVLGTYSLAAINRCLALSLEAQYPGAVRFIPWENGPVVDIPSVLTCSATPLAKLIARAEHLTGPEVVISHHYPVHVPPLRGDLRVAMVFWEESLVPFDTIRLLNRNFDAVFAPSSAVADALINSGLSLPVRIVGVAPDITSFLRLGAERKPFSSGMGRPLTFLHVSSCFPRKGVDVLLAAYARAFRKGDPVRLVIKGFPNPHNDVPQQIEQLRQHDPDTADITMISDDLDDSGMLELYRNADVVVLPTRGEGFNLPAAEAVAAGIPLIVTNYGGHLDFLSAEDVRLVDFRFAPSRSHLAGAGSLWAEPDLDDLAVALRSLFEDIAGSTGESITRASRARERIRERLAPQTWIERISDSAVELITASQVRRPKMAWVSTWGVRCGIAEYSRSLIEALVRHPEAAGQSVVVLCDDRTSSSSNSEHVRVRPAWQLGDATSMQLLSRTISVEDPDVVVIQYHRGIVPWEGLLNILADRRVSRRVTVVTLHAARHLLELSSAKQEEVVSALRRVARVLVHRTSDLNLLKELGLLTNTALFPHGAPQPTGGLLARNLTEHAAPVIGCHGFFLPGKGIPRLIKAFAELRKTWPHLRLRLVNAEYPVPESAAEIERCRALAASVGIGSGIEWHTEFYEMDECRRILSACDLLVLPYDASEESASGALHTALSSCVPTAVTPTTIFDEAAEAVYRFSGVDSVSVAAGIDALLRDARTRTELQRSASEWLSQRSWSRLAERMSGLIAGLCAAQSTRRAIESREEA